MIDLETMLSAALQPSFGDAPVALQRSAHADFQANGVLALARRMGRPGPEVAAEILAGTGPDLAGLATAEVSGPGYLNLTVRAAALDTLLATMAADDRLGVPQADKPQRVLVDYGGPNVAKEMHVGHLRSTIIGDALVRALRFVGHDVLAVSHLGDWGTPFGMLLERLLEMGEAAAAHELSIGDLDGFYKAARRRFDTDPLFAEKARRRVVALQSGDAETLRLWRILVDESARYFETVNARLHVGLSTSDFVGESFYNDRLDDVVRELAPTESGGALVVYPPGFTGRDGQPFPLLVRKSDGGYGYQATDLAALRYRLLELKADRIVYVLGAPQQQHLAMVAAVARAAGWVGSAEVVHKPFGSVLGPDGKMLASRAGTSVKLIDLIDEAVARAAELVQARPDLTDGERAAIADAVGIGAVKYADLSTDLIKDYTYDPDRMISFVGDTGGYLQMAHARARSILRQGTQRAAVAVQAPAERALALELLAFPRGVTAMVAELEPHRLAGQLRRIAVAFTGFWEACPVLRADPPVRASRLALCDLAARVLAQGLDLLGIAAPDRM